MLGAGGWGLGAGVLEGGGVGGLGSRRIGSWGLRVRG